MIETFEAMFTIGAALKTDIMLRYFEGVYLDTINFSMPKVMTKHRMPQVIYGTRTMPVSQGVGPAK